jgi:Predicted phosphatase
MERRQFLEFMGRGAIAASVIGSSFLLQACATAGNATTGTLPSLPPTTEDKLNLVSGLKYDLVVKQGDVINSLGERFGANNDFLAFMPGVSANEAFLWSNHEYFQPIFVSGYNPEKNPGVRKTKAQADQERKVVGGSYVRIHKVDGAWAVDGTSKDAFRVDATTPIALIADRPIENATTAIGMTGNCSGGTTPWGTILTCEENFQDFFGSTKYAEKNGKQKRHVIASSSVMAWDDFYPHAPEHYGWVVEVNPRTRECKKLTSMGRFAHEGALVVQAADGRCVVYMGDDTQDEHFYKFIADKKGSLEKGKLYVADLKAGQWLLLSLENPKLKGHFKDHTELMIRTREAAKLVGATPMDRPEGCAQDPISKNIFLNCTMNKGGNRPYGSVMKFTETNGDHLAMTFKSEVFLAGGEATGFACPDNMAFDRKGNLWITTDIADYDLGQGEYKSFGNNGLFYVPLSGENAGKVFRFATAPNEAEMTGPCFSDDGKVLFLSIQHPGANTVDLTKPTSNWPEGGTSMPKSSVVAISGPLLDQLLA